MLFQLSAAPTAACCRRHLHRERQGLRAGGQGLLQDHHARHHQLLVPGRPVLPLWRGSGPALPALPAARAGAGAGRVRVPAAGAGQQGGGHLGRALGGSGHGCSFDGGRITALLARLTPPPLCKRTMTCGRAGGCGSGWAARYRQRLQQPVAERRRRSQASHAWCPPPAVDCLLPLSSPRAVQASMWRALLLSAALLCALLDPAHTFKPLRGEKGGVQARNTTGVCAGLRLGPRGSVRSASRAKRLPPPPPSPAATAAAHSLIPAPPNTLLSLNPPPRLRRKGGRMLPAAAG